MFKTQDKQVKQQLREYTEQKAMCGNERKLVYRMQ